jgi:hypothetical protein
MASAVGTYATLTDLKLRLNITDATDDSLLQSLCDQVNSLIEGVTGRILAPIPAFSTTLTNAQSTGDSSIQLNSGSGLAVGDALLVGTVTGTREHFIVGAISHGSTVTAESPLLNSYSSGTTAQRCQIFDGLVDDRQAWGFLRLVMAVPMGINSCSSLELTPTWNALSTNWALVPSTDRLLRPTPLDREPGWPATEIHLTNIPSVGNTYPYFAGYDAIARVVGTFGWPAVPDEIVDIALTTATRAWVGRQAGQQDIVGTDTFGRPMVSRYLSGRDRDTLMRYTSKDVGVI